MTGEKDRFSTQEKLWKLDDDTLGTTEHDKMVLQLLDIEYLVELIPELKNDFEKPHNANIRKGLSSEYENMLRDIWKDRPVFPNLEKIVITYAEKTFKKVSEVEQKRFEQFLEGYGSNSTMEAEMLLLSHFFLEIKNAKDEITAKVAAMFDGRNYLEQSQRRGELFQCWIKDNKTTLHDKITQDYHDNANEIKVDMSKFLAWNSNKKARYGVLLEHPIMNGKFIIGYWDAKVFPLRYDGTYLIPEYPPQIFIEVKPKIRSFGQTLRQIQTYRRYRGNGEDGPIYIYTPETQFDAAFESQGIRVVHPIHCGAV
jgi:hypothetical protein